MEETAGSCAWSSCFSAAADHVDWEAIEYASMPVDCNIGSCSSHPA